MDLAEETNCRKPGRFRRYFVIAFATAVALTAAGWEFAPFYKFAPPWRLALWFPLVVIAAPRGLDGIALSLLQFPLFAAAFAMGIRRWRVRTVLVVLAMAYALLVVIAYAMIPPH